VLNACFYFVVNEHCDCQVLLTIRNAMVQLFVRALSPKHLKMSSSNTWLLIVIEFVLLTDEILLLLFVGSES